MDSLFDFLLVIGMKPFIELSFMPSGIASGSSEVFHYRGNITPPQNYDTWSEMITKLADHLISRYGIKEVRSWYFEVWNEPNLDAFWDGTQEEYFRLYQYTANALKKVDSYLPVGGPATARNEWILGLIEYCSKNDVPLEMK